MFTVGQEYIYIGAKADPELYTLYKKYRCTGFEGMCDVCLTDNHGNKHPWGISVAEKNFAKFVPIYTDDIMPASGKPTNPKDAVGIKKVPMSTVPANVLMEVGLAMMEGALKYGRHNYRAVGVRASVYFDAAKRHLDDWWEGVDIDKDSGLSHLSKAMACLVVLRDSMARGNMTDDRPPASPEGWMEELNKKAEELLEKYPNPKPACTRGTES